MNTYQEPKSETWDRFPQKYLTGDLVMTEYGKAVVLDYSHEKYSVWPLPGWKWKKEDWGWKPAKGAWYEESELSIIKWGLAHFIREQEQCHTN